MPSVSDFLGSFLRGTQEESTELISDPVIDADVVDIPTEERPVEERVNSTPSGGGRVGVYGVGSYIETNIPGQRRSNQPQQEEVHEGEVVEGLAVDTEDRLQLEEGYVEGELVEINEDDLIGSRQIGLLKAAEDEEFIEADFTDLDVKEEYEDQLALSPTSIESEIVEAYEDDDRYGLVAAEAFTDLNFADEDGEGENFSEEIGFLDNDFVDNQNTFVASSFETQGVMPPFYPSQGLAFAGFSEPEDEAYEADFALGSEF